MVGRLGDLDDASLLGHQVPEEDPVERLCMVDRCTPPWTRRAKRVHEAFVDQAANDRRLVRHPPSVEIAREDDGEVGACGPEVVDDNLVDLFVAEPVVLGALDMRVVEEHATRFGSKSHPASLSRLEGIEAPPQSRLIRKGQRKRVADRVPTQHGLASEGRNVPARLPDLLELAGEHPVQTEIVGQILGHAAVAGAPSAHIHLLKEIEVSVQRGQRVANILISHPLCDVPRHNGQPAIRRRHRVDPGWLSDDRVHLLAFEQRISGITRQPEQAKQHQKRVHVSAPKKNGLRVRTSLQCTARTSACPARPRQTLVASRLNGETD
jgi:hypothetical protein